MSTEEIHKEMTQVMKRGGGLAVVARAVDSLNITLATHAAWTDERFERVDTRLDKVEHRLDKVEHRLGKVEQRLDRVEIRLDRIETRLGDVEARLGGVEAGQSRILNELDKMSVKMDRVLSFAIRHEFKADEIKE